VPQSTQYRGTGRVARTRGAVALACFPLTPERAPRLLLAVAASPRVFSSGVVARTTHRLGPAIPIVQRTRSKKATVPRRRNARPAGRKRSAGTRNTPPARVRPAPPAPAEGPLLGAHMSTAGGLPNAIARALAVRSRVLQLFTRNCNQWKARPLSDLEVGAFRAAWEASGLVSAAAHDSYLINLASPDAALRDRSIDALMEELRRCEALGIPYLVAHPGAHVGGGVRDGCDRAAESLNRAIAGAHAPHVMVLLETVAGQGTTLGRRFEELHRIRDRVESKGRVGACLDTCHVHAAGYDLVTERGWEETFTEFDAILGLESLRWMHLNDSKNERGSRVDRHDHIGRGRLGTEPFARILRDPRLQTVPKTLETPKGKDGVVMDRRNLALLRKLVLPR